MTDKPTRPDEEGQPPEGYEPPQVDEVTSPVAAAPDAAPTNQDQLFSDRDAKADFVEVEPDDALSAARGLVAREYAPPRVEDVDSPVAASPGTQVQTGVDRQG